MCSTPHGSRSLYSRRPAADEPSQDEWLSVLKRASKHADAAEEIPEDEDQSTDVDETG